MRMRPWICLFLLAALASPALPLRAASDARLLLITPAVELPDDYDAVLKRAAKSKASLVVLPLRNSADGHEGAFELADLALKSGLFGKVSVGDDLGAADYAVTGSWNAWTQPHGGSAGLGRWMNAFATVKLELLFEGTSFAKVDFENVDAEVYMNPPFSPLQLAEAARTGLHQAYRKAFYRMAQDMLKRSGR